jgi:hypothetical protein
VKTLYIRPNYGADGPLQAITLTRCAGPPLQDSDVVAHFPASTTGAEVREIAAEFYAAENVIWGGAL